MLTRVLVGGLSNAEAAGELGLSVRQVRRLKGALARGGRPALAHGNRGRHPAHRLPDEVRARLVELVRGPYAGWSQQRQSELLAQHEQLVVSRSTLRRVLLAAGVPSPRKRARRLPPGCLPVGFDLAHRTVELLDLQGAELRESTFHQTVERWRRERPEALRFELDLEAFSAAARLEPGQQPDGFIFDAGRCGSAPLANALSSSAEHLVLKESPAVNALLAGLLNATDRAVRLEREALVALALPFMFRPLRGTEKRLFVRLSSWNIRLADTLLRLFPATPAVFCYRPATEVVASMLARPPGWKGLRDRPRVAQGRVFPSLASVPAEGPLSEAAFYTHTWRSAAEDALALPPARLLLIEYAQVQTSPDVIVGQLADHFRLDLNQAARSSMCQSLVGLADGPASPALEPDQEGEVAPIVGDLPRRLAARQSASGGVGLSQADEHL